MVFKTNFSSYLPDPSCNYSALNPLVLPIAKSSVFLNYQLSSLGCYINLLDLKCHSFLKLENTTVHHTKGIIL